jgi:predicted amidohydrolase
LKFWIYRIPIPHHHLTHLTTPPRRMAVYDSRSGGVYVVFVYQSINVQTAACFSLRAHGADRSLLLAQGARSVQTAACCGSPRAHGAYRPQPAAALLRMRFSRDDLPPTAAIRL